MNASSRPERPAWVGNPTPMRLDLGLAHHPTFARLRAPRDAVWSGPNSTQGPHLMRPSGRTPDALRDVSITTGFSRHAEGSALIRMGNTEVLCAASVETRVPPFLRNTGLGWVTAEYGMLPRATHTRGDREAARGKQSGRTQEIQRLIGRSLRAVVDLKAMGEKTD